MDYFAWMYEQMSSLERQLVEHELPIKPDYQPHIQPSRRMSGDVEKLVADEIKRLTEAGFIRKA